MDTEKKWLPEGGVLRDWVKTVKGLRTEVGSVLISWSGLTETPMRSDCAATWTAALRIQTHTWNGNVGRQSKAIGKGFWCRSDNIRGSSKRGGMMKDWLDLWFEGHCRQDYSTLLFSYLLTLLSPRVCFTDKTDSATESDRGPYASKLKKLEMTAWVLVKLVQFTCVFKFYYVTWVFDCVWCVWIWVSITWIRYWIIEGHKASKTEE